MSCERYVICKTSSNYQAVLSAECIQVYQLIDIRFSKRKSIASREDSYNLSLSCAMLYWKKYLSDDKVCFRSEIL